MDATSHQNWYQWTDGIEDVSVYDSSANTTDSTVKALRIGPRQPQIGGQVGIDSYDVVFRLDAGTANSEPSQGDTITDSGSVVYTVLYVDSLTVGSTAIAYDCSCRKQVTTT